MRKKGFSLVELLIVLAVMAALIATITPVALNAIRKAKATQVAQNLKTLASAFENKLYVDGTTEITTDVSELARDVDTQNYGIAYESNTTGEYTVTVYYTGEDVDPSSVADVLSGATTSTDRIANGVTTGTNYIYYTINITAY